MNRPLYYGIVTAEHLGGALKTQEIRRPLIATVEFDAERYYCEMLDGEHLDELGMLADHQLEELATIGAALARRR